MKKDNYTIKFANHDNLDEIAKIHKKSYPSDHFLNELSVSLIRNYYKSLLKYNVIFLVYIKQKKVLGFIAGGIIDILDKARYDFIKKNKFKLFLFTVSKLYSIKFIMKIIPRFIDLLNKIFLKQSVKDTHSRNSFASFDIFSIAVSNELKGKGIADILLVNFEKKLKMISVERYFLTVRKSNYRAIKFYRGKDFYNEEENEKEIRMCKLLK